MKTQWLIETTDPPACYIAAEGGLTYQALKARQFDTKDEAEGIIKALHLGKAWKAEEHILPQNSPH